MRKPNIELLNIDCLEYLKQCGDKEFDLAIVDPPYGIDEKFKGGKTGKMNFNEIVNKDWDKVPSKEYFEQLRRVSQNQIIWGGNYFDLPPTRCFIVWDKVISDDFSLAMCEMAWTSFDKLAKIFKYYNPKGNKIHPTQKPIKLYEWLLDKYAGQEAKILDTHLGSGSIAAACWNRGFDLVGLEIDKDYYTKAVKRFEQHKKQLTLF